MKSKLTTYLLITAVAGIWGTIIFKVVSGINPDIPEIPTVKNIAEFNPKPVTQTESFTISDVERDPFLGTLIKKKQSKSKRIKKSNPSEVVITPNINYAGIVKNGKDQVFILTIDSQQYLIRKGQTIKNVKLVSGTSKQIVVRFNNTNSTILVD